ncbi:MAG: hypothetical protein ACI825_000492 [Planctomycetota bacterium]|jgi:hypothetical protein|uniref:DUF6686 family protein n=1 Tax=Patiriisocius sp. Uisw_047 TaxID=3230969 RepID=UPI0039EB8FF2
MCNQVKTISKNCNGQLTFCEDCKVYKLIFNNIFLEFKEKELKSFKSYVATIEIEYWETKYDGIVMKRKIPIGTMQNNLSMVFNKQEIASLKSLLSIAEKKTNLMLSVLDIDYTTFLN